MNSSAVYSPNHSTKKKQWRRLIYSTLIKTAIWRWKKFRFYLVKIQKVSSMSSKVIPTGFYWNQCCLSLYRCFTCWNETLGNEFYSGVQYARRCRKYYSELSFELTTFTFRCSEDLMFYRLAVAHLKYPFCYQVFEGRFGKLHCILL